MARATVRRYRRLRCSVRRQGSCCWQTSRAWTGRQRRRARGRLGHSCSYSQDGGLADVVRGYECKLLKVTGKGRYGARRNGEDCIILVPVVIVCRWSFLCMRQVPACRQRAVPFVKVTLWEMRRGKGRCSRMWGRCNLQSCIIPHRGARRFFWQILLVGISFSLAGLNLQETSMDRCGHKSFSRLL